MTRNKEISAKYSAIMAQLDKVIGKTIANPWTEEQVKAEKERSREILRLAQELREICD